MRYLDLYQPILINDFGRDPKFSESVASSLIRDSIANSLVNAFQIESTSKHPQTGQPIQNMFDLEPRQARLWAKVKDALTLTEDEVIEIKDEAFDLLKERVMKYKFPATNPVIATAIYDLLDTVTVQKEDDGKRMFDERKDKKARTIRDAWLELRGKEPAMVDAEKNT